jgi:hypothetical protein
MYQPAISRCIAWDLNIHATFNIQDVSREAYIEWDGCGLTSCVVNVIGRYINKLLHQIETDEAAPTRLMKPPDDRSASNVALNCKKARLTL